MDQATTLCIDYTDLYTEPDFELASIVCSDGSVCDLTTSPENHTHEMVHAALAHIQPTQFIKPQRNKDVERRWKHLNKKIWKDGSLLQAHVVTHPTQADHYIFLIGKAGDVSRRIHMPSEKKFEVERATSHVMKSGFHVSSIAYKKTFSGKVTSDDAHELQFLAHIIMRPILKKNISAIHRDLAQKNIRLRILSHDSLETCKSIMRNAGISCTDDACETGERIQSMHDEELASILPHTTLFAETTDLDRQRIMRLLEQRGERVLTSYGAHAR